MTDTLGAQAVAAAAAVTGPDTPDHVQATTKPSALLTFAMAAAGPVITALLAYVVWILGDRHHWPATVAPALVDALKWIGMSLCGCLGVVTIRLASGQFKRADVKAGPASLSVGTD